MANDNYNAATRRSTPLDALANGAGHSGAVLSATMARPRTPRRSKGSELRTNDLPEGTRIGGGRLSAGNNTALPGSPGIPGGDLPNGNEAKTSAKAQVTFDWQSVAFWLVVAWAMIMFLRICLTSHDTTVGYTAPMYHNLHTPTASDVRESLRVGRAELMQLQYRPPQKRIILESQHPFRVDY